MNTFFFALEQELRKTGWNYMCIDSTRDGDLYKQYNTAKKLKLTESAIFMAQKIIYYKLRKLTFDRFNVFIFFLFWSKWNAKKKLFDFPRLSMVVWKQVSLVISVMSAWPIITCNFSRCNQNEIGTGVYRGQRSCKLRRKSFEFDHKLHILRARKKDS